MRCENCDLLFCDCWCDCGQLKASGWCNCEMIKDLKEKVNE